MCAILNAVTFIGGQWFYLMSNTKDRAEEKSHSRLQQITSGSLLRIRWSFWCQWRAHLCKNYQIVFIVDLKPWFGDWILTVPFLIWGHDWAGQLNAGFLLEKIEIITLISKSFVRNEWVNGESSTLQSIMEGKMLILFPFGTESVLFCSAWNCWISNSPNFPESHLRRSRSTFVE